MRPSLLGKTLVTQGDPNLSESNQKWKTEIEFCFSKFEIQTVESTEFRTSNYKQITSATEVIFIRLKSISVIG